MKDTQSTRQPAAQGLAPSSAPAFEPAPAKGLGARLRRWRNRKVADPAFQRWASAGLLTRGRASRDGVALFDIVAGFVNAQVLQALVELNILRDLRDAPASAAQLGAHHGIAAPRMRRLLDAGVALGLLDLSRQGYQTGRQGAAALGVPGLLDMIRHHAVFYRDMADPVALLRGDTETELARFWPYVFGAGAAGDPALAERYSALMTDSQALVAEETLRTIGFDDTRHLMDVGGGTGAFLRAAAATQPQMQLTLFDLPAVVPAATAAFAEAGLTARTVIHPGSFRDDPLPQGADTVSLVRVLYDHEDDTVLALLRSVHAALPAGGTLVVSEPMRGGKTPHRAGDVYFAFYCMAMQTGTARSPEEICQLLEKAGFAEIEQPKSRRPFVTSVITARRP
ncbi:MAG: acetylserotonin O-methyltransferase [Oceanicola sp.]|nr:acetylserotonin O-methyltransferase [Oceanicola sp.]